jgi:hypothetical protein
MCDVTAFSTMKTEGDKNKKLAICCDSISFELIRYLLSYTIEIHHWDYL